MKWKPQVPLCKKVLADLNRLKLNVSKTDEEKKDDTFGGNLAMVFGLAMEEETKARFKSSVHKAGLI